MVAIDSGLSIIALDPAIRSLEDVAVWVGVIALSLRFGVPGCIGWQRALRHCRWISLGGNGAQLQPCGLSLVDRQLLSVM